MKTIIIIALIFLSSSCDTRYFNNKHKLSKKVVIEKDTVQVIDVDNFYLYLSDGRKVDVEYPIMEK